MMKMDIKYKYKYNIGDKVMTKGGHIDVISKRFVYYGSAKYQLVNGCGRYEEDSLTLVEGIIPKSYVDDLEDTPFTPSHRSISTPETNNQGDSFMCTIKDIRLDIKTILIPKENAAPDKVECQTVIVTTKDGKEHEAVCYPGDEFDLERGIEIACLKAYFGGANAYNKKMRDAVKFYKACEKKRKYAKKADDEKARIEAKKKANAARKAARARQKRIDEMSEAFLIALNKHDAPVDVSLSGICEAYLDSSEITGTVTYAIGDCK